MRLLMTQLLIAGALVLLAAPAHCEYYQYRDASGVLRFTDDIANVPPEQRTDVKTYQSVRSSQSQPADIKQEKGNGSRKPLPINDNPSPQSGSWNERISRQADELDRMQVELVKDYSALQSERAALEKNVPSAWATKEIRKAYRRQVKALNAKIARYETQYAQYREKEKTFNSRYNK